MSVLYKALEKAARQNARGEPGTAAANEGGVNVAAAPPPLAPPAAGAATAGDGGPRRGRTVVRVLALVFLLGSAAAMTGLLLFQDEVETLLTQATGDAPVYVTPPEQAPQPQADPQPAPPPDAVAVAEAQAPQPAAASAPDQPAAPASDAGDGPAASAPSDTARQDETARRMAEADDAPAVDPTDAPKAGRPSGAATADTAAADPAPQAPSPAAAPVEDNIAALMAEGAARRSGAEPADATTPAPPSRAPEDTEAAAPPRPERLDAEAGLRAQRSTDASAAAGAPVTIDTGSGAGPAPGPAPRVGNVSVSSVPTETRDTLAGGYGALMRGNYAGALNAYDSVLDREPDNVSALMGRAAALHKLGMAAEARAAYERVLARQPDNREALTNMIALIGDADPATAIAELERLQSVAPDFSPVPAQLGMLLARQGRVGEAMGALRRAIVLSPENALYHYNMAVVADRAGRAADAARSYDRVLRLIDGGGAPAGLRAQAIRDRLRYLRARL